ncbi:response regulator transcription factor [Helicobacter mustelae]|uniref:Two-component response regulator n=1 Tax=Helicobacter mustelae (strain ATCC 43772 / CCUG 25715 / CIP 103759 / LMG 18044 / NCTC 12198 / R85-136P) TaxID=679897 RepID=D3UGA0_HELM1|nr:response regulator transcription factor [Helicobacter mustelae]CBG39521.1 two-component response regulator [Helicobacter mustelae 12198]SQH71032.1 two-component response regulator [Helicobacter mustelae]STP12161.1 two-component response regulator [Helicobacter mustelae]
MGNLLLVEDDLEIQRLIVTYLKQANFEVIATASSSEALEILEKQKNIDLLILDLTLPEMNGLELCKKIRTFSSIPIIISSAHADLYNKIQGFERGADDYLSKPYEPAELIARIHALLRRFKPKELEFDNLSINIQKREALLDGKRVNLTNIEFEILILLIENRLYPVSREAIVSAISAIREESSLRSIDTHVRNLRTKLGDSAKVPKFIQSVWAIGYKFCL